MMFTPEQEKWLAHLSDHDQVKIIPFDPTAAEKFEAVMVKIQSVLGPQTVVVHRGATSFGISGQDEIDVYVPVPEKVFNRLLDPLTAAFGRPRSHYPLERARFVLIESGKHVDIFLINEASQGWINGNKFDQYLRSHPDALEQYRLLKEAGEGLSTQAYYRRKIAFFNEVLLKVERESAAVEREV